ncbi:MAG: hypothetical protein AAF933_04665 [Pseudomonadota bacterium]
MTISASTSTHTSAIRSELRAFAGAALCGWVSMPRRKPQHVVIAAKRSAQFQEAEIVN